MLRQGNKDTQKTILDPDQTFPDHIMDTLKKLGR